MRKGCPTGAITVRVSPEYESLGDYRWTGDLILATWEQAEMGRVSGRYEYRMGAPAGALTS